MRKRLIKNKQVRAFNSVLRFILCIIMTAVLVLFSDQRLTAFADSYIGTLSYWHSNGSSVGKWNQSNFYIGMFDLSGGGNFSSYFSAGVFSACTQWDNALNVNVSATTNPNISTFNVYGGSASQIGSGSSSFTESELSSSTLAGLTKYTHSYWGKFKYYPSGNYYVEKTAYIITTAASAILNITYSTGTQNKIKNVCLHEIGHAFGWFDHTSISTDVMYSYVTTITVLSNDDIEHLHQIYNNGWY